jgi:PAS domain S-box-containing protein
VRKERGPNLGTEPPSESELKQFFDLALDLMVVVGFDGYFKRVNPVAERILGYSRRELLSRPFTEFLHPDDIQRTDDQFAKLMMGGDEVIGFENRYRCANGSVRWIQWNSRTVRERDFLYGVGRDVTDRRRADAELREAHRMVEASAAELAASRARIVAATDAERRRVVRDLHDGAQQRLVHAVITLKQARSALQNDQEDLPRLVAEALDHTECATAELRELAHGILPAVLTSGGLRAGVQALTSRMPLSVTNGVSVGRLPAAVEATAYFVVCEALTNVAKHARAGHAEATARIEDGTLVVRVRDDGVGGARPEGSGLVGLADRLAALDGLLRVETPPDDGTLITAAIPLAGSAAGSEARPEL